MKKLYKCSFTIYDTVEIPNEETGETQSHNHRFEGKFHVVCDDLEDAIMDASCFLEESFEDADYELTGVKAVKDVEIVNLDIECQCAYCRGERLPPDDRLEFACICQERLTLAPDGWTIIKCAGCGREIKREDINLVNGKYEYRESKK
jgi:hypothetical protein